MLMKYSPFFLYSKQILYLKATSFSLLLSHFSPFSKMMITCRPVPEVLLCLSYTFTDLCAVLIHGPNLLPILPMSEDSTWILKKKQIGIRLNDCKLYD